MEALYQIARQALMALPIEEQIKVIREFSCNEPMLTVDDAMHILQVSDDTIRRAIKDHALNVSYIGQNIRIKRSDLEIYIVSRQRR